MTETYADAVAQYGSQRAAERALGLSTGTISHARRRAAAKQAPEPWNFPVSEGYKLGKVTSHRRADGTLIEVWDRQHPLVEDIEQAKEAIREFIAEQPPIASAPARGDRRTDIIPWVQIGDAHFGMLAHEAETGANFDLRIAERELCAAIGLLIDEMGEHERVVINDLGDFTHYENTSGTTEASGHALDIDGRNPKMIRVYSRTMRFIIDKVLEKADFVDVIVNQGNHSRVNDWWMRELIEVAYGHEGRVRAINNDSVFIGYRMGDTFVMTHHSDKCRPPRLAQVMATDFAQDWGEAKYRYIDIGHIHHGMVLKEHPGVTIESWNILANPDKYAHDGGWRSRQAISIVHRSRKYGEVGRRRMPIEEVRDAIEAAHKAQRKRAPYRPQAKRAIQV